MSKFWHDQNTLNVQAYAISAAAFLRWNFSICSKMQKFTFIEIQMKLRSYLICTEVVRRWRLLLRHKLANDRVVGAGMFTQSKRLGVGFGFAPVRVALGKYFANKTIAWLAAVKTIRRLKDFSRPARRVKRKKFVRRRRWRQSSVFVRKMFYIFLSVYSAPAC